MVSVLDIADDALCRLDAQGSAAGIRILGLDRQPVEHPSPAQPRWDGLFEAGRRIGLPTPGPAPLICCLPPSWLDIETIRLPQDIPPDEPHVRLAADECYEGELEHSELAWLDAGPAGFGPVAGRELTLLRTDPDTLAQQRSLLEKMGNPTCRSHTAIESMVALAERLDPPETPACRCLVRIGVAASTLVVSLGGRTIAARNIPIGSWRIDHMAEDPTVELSPGIDEQSPPAGPWGDAPSDSGSGISAAQQPEVLSLAEATRQGEHSALHLLAEEIKLTLRYVQVMFGGLCPSVLHVLGGEHLSCDPQLVLSTELGLDLASLQPAWAGVVVGGSEPQADSAGPMTVAMGLVMLALADDSGWGGFGLDGARSSA